MRATTAFVVLLLGLAVSHGIPTSKIEKSLKEPSNLEKVEIGDEKDRTKKSAEFYEMAQRSEQNPRQIRAQRQAQSCGCNQQHLQSILLPSPQPVVQPVHTLHILSPSQPCGQSSPTVNIVQPQSPAQPPQTLNIIQPAPPCPQSAAVVEQPEALPHPEPEPQFEPEPLTEPPAPEQEPEVEHLELEIVPVQEPCQEQVVVMPSQQMYYVPEVKPQLAAVVEVPTQPCTQHVVSECSCRPRTSAYRNAVETLRYAPSSGYRQAMPLTRTIRSEQEANKE